MMPRFISLEGCEGVGKSTNLEYIAQFLKRHKIDFIQTREPGGCEFAEALRSLILSDVATGISAEAELLAVFAARAEHVEKVIQPALQAGKWVLCDRFSDASYAYQGGGRGMDFARIKVIETWLLQGFAPDATLLLDAPIAVGMARADNRGELDRFEREQQEFFHNVRTAYLQRAKAEPARFYIIDASKDLAAVQLQIEMALTKLIGTT